MVKKKLTYLFVALLAFLVFYGGAGINYISYCCDDCRSAGFEVVTSDKCCEIHEHEHDQDHNHDHVLTGTHDECSDHLCETTCCTLQRIDFEWDQSSNPIFSFQPLEIDLLSMQIPTAALLPDLELTETLFVRHDGPPLIVCPRVYLSLLTTLLI